MDDANESESVLNIEETSADLPLALLDPEIASTASDRADWLIDNAETYGRLLESLRGARRSVHIAQLAFDADCAAYSGGSLATIGIGRCGDRGDSHRSREGRSGPRFEFC